MKFLLQESEETKRVCLFLRRKEIWKEKIRQSETQIFTNDHVPRQGKSFYLEGEKKKKTIKPSI